MNKLRTIDVALDEMLVNLAAIVMRLSKPETTPNAGRTARIGAIGASIRGLREALERSACS
ncbi:hypothetical protein ACVWW2_008007 [Bradyrhizobium sp. LM4.3]